MRFAVIGTNWISETFVNAVAECRAIPGYGAVELAAIHSRTQDKAERFAHAFSIPLTFTSLEALAQSPDVDAVYIATPNACHKEQSIMMMRGGKHVLCEKPITVSAHDFAEMLDVAQACDVVLLEAAKHLFSPGLAALRALLPEIGPVRRVSLSKSQYLRDYDALKAGGDIPNVFRKDLTGGALLDIGMYCVALMVALFGEPKSLVSSATFLPTGADGQGAALATYDGFVAELSYGHMSLTVAPSVIQGEKGSLMFLNPSTIDKIDVAMRNGEKRNVQCMDKENQMIYQIKALCDTARQPSMAQEYHGYSMATLRVMDEVRRQYEGYA